MKLYSMQRTCETASDASLIIICVKLNQFDFQIASRLLLFTSHFLQVNFIEWVVYSTVK